MVLVGGSWAQRKEGLFYRHEDRFFLWILYYGCFLGCDLVKTIALQNINGSLIPFSPEDKESLSSFKENQVLIAKVSGTMKGRSLEQLRTFMACCNFVANNVREYDLNSPKYKDGAHWNTKEKVAFQIKVALHFVDESKMIVYQDRIVFHYRSLSFKNLKHLGACKFFDRGFPLLALRIGMTEDDMVAAAQSLMGGM